MTTVLTRDGTREPVCFDKIRDRVRTLCDMPPALEAVDVVTVCQKVIQGIHDGVRTSQLDELAADTAAALALRHPQYSALAARLCVSNLHKMTSPSVASVLPRLAEDVRAFAERHRTTLDEAIQPRRDYDFDYFGFKTLERSYLLRDAKTDAVLERPQTLWMRVALGVHCGDLAAALETYEHLSLRRFTHATPTMFHAGLPRPHLASCFLLPIIEDSIEGIKETEKRTALISKSAGGVGFSVSNVRAAGSRIHSTGGRAAGLLPMLRCFDATARYVDQGGGKRKGAFAAYLEPWHADVFTFLDMRKNHGAEELRARDLFYALWIPDLFMRRVEADADWTLLCPDACPDLVDKYGADFDAAYEAYEAAGKGVRVVRAQELWSAVLVAQIETGTPFMLYKDAANRKSNQRNLGTIRSSNLCTEIVQYSSATEVAVCNLGSLSLPACLVEVSGAWTFDFALLATLAGVLTRNLNRVIDRNHYPCPEARASNLRHRPMGIGVQGLADVFAVLGYPYEEAEARALNRAIFETIYYGAVDASCALAERDGPYETFAGSPASEGLLQFDLWDAEQGTTEATTAGCPRYDWAALKARVRTHGLRNSLLVAPMPTASTAQILGNTECFEPFTSNVYARRVLAGEFPVVNRHLVARLEALGLWTEEVRLRLMADNGSVRNVPGLPEADKRVFKTAWEMSMRPLLDMAADRGRFVCQSQSLNLFKADPSPNQLSSMHFYGWRRGLKTGMYYLRTAPATDAVKVTVPVAVCRRPEAEEECLACSA